MKMMTLRCLALWLGSGLALCSLQAAKIEAYGELPADARDQYGDTIGGIGSGIAYDPKEDVYYCMPDRGPGDGAMPYRPRFVKLTIAQEGGKLEPKPVGSVLLRDLQGREMTGLIPDDPHAPSPQMQDGTVCMDPEAISLAPDGTIYVSEEYGPCLYQFQRDGRMIRRIDLPEEFRPKTADGKLDFSGTADLVSGRGINQGGEGMCISPDGKSAIIVFQSGLMQDGGEDSPNTRMLVLDLTSGKPLACYNYPFATEVPGTGKKLKVDKLSVNDLQALPDGRFLVLERDKWGRNGSKTHKTAAYKSVWVTDTSGATNLLEPHDKTVPVRKALLFNLPELVQNPASLEAKWESIVVLPSSKPDKIDLLMAADNDFLTPVVHENGKDYPFPRVEEAQATPFFKIQAEMPENP